MTRAVRLSTARPYSAEGARGGRGFSGAAHKLLALAACSVFALGMGSQAKAYSADQAVGLSTKALNATPPSGVNFGMVGDGSTDNSSALAAALSSVGNGKLYLPCGSYKFSTPIVLTSARPMIEGAATRCVTLWYTGTSGAALTFNANVSGGNKPGFGLRNLSLLGPGGGGSTVGVQIGDPSNVGSSQAQDFTAENVDIGSFGTNVQYGSGTWLTSFRGSSIHDGGVNLSYPQTLTNAGEEIDFTDTTFWNGSAGSANCVNIAGYVVNMNFKGGSFDNCPVTINSPNTHVLFHGNHFENPAGAAANPFVTQTSGYVTYEGVNVFMNTLPTAPALFTAAAGSVVEMGLYVYNNAGSILPNVFAISGTANFYESGTHPFIGTNGVQNFAVNTGTGTLTMKTSPAVLRSAVGIYEDPEGNGNFGATSQVAHARQNAGPVNLVRQSNNFTDGSWTVYANAPTLTANTTDVSDPFGGNNATKLVNGSAGNAGLLQPSIAADLVANTSYTGCIWARTLTGTQAFRMGPNDPAGAFTATASWARYCDTQTQSATASADNRVFEIFTSNGSSPLYIYGASDVPGTEGGVYVPTTTSAFVPAALHTIGLSSAGPAQIGNTTDYANFDAHGWLSWNGSSPALSACGTTTLDSKATNSSGTLTFAGTPTSCTVTFSKSGFATFDHCRVVPESSLSGFGYSYTLTTMTITATSLTGKADYTCDGL